ncbi:MAG TPA: hypothetical protein VGE40_03385 [Bacilli bacterium]
MTKFPAIEEQINFTEEHDTVIYDDETAARRTVVIKSDLYETLTLLQQHRKGSMNVVVMSWNQLKQILNPSKEA